MKAEPEKAEIDEDGASSVRPEPTRILILDDDEVYLHLCKRYLRSDPSAKHTIVSANTIEEAELACRVDTFDCFVVDYGLPDGTGVEAIERLRQMLKDNMPSAIVLTGRSGEEVAVGAVRSGASDFLLKGTVTRSALCRAVGNAIEKNRLEKLHLRRLKELEIANGLLRKRNDEIQRFYHTVSHEVKTPLTAIQEFLAILRDGLAGELVGEQKTIINYALESCDQIKTHFNELLDLSRFETGKIKMTLTPSSIYPVFDHCIVAATPAAVAKKITLTIDDVPDLPLVMMQSNRIIQVLSNLIGNALKFTPELGAVKVGATLSEDGKRLRLSVKDTGCGIEKQDLKRVFDRLYQVVPAGNRANESGMGLGLSIASQIVELHHSCIGVESTISQGSEFWFDLEVC